MRGGSPIPQIRRLRPGSTIEKISAREREVIAQASLGLADKEIAHALKISIRTVGTYWERIRLKTGGGNRTACVALILNEEAENRAREASIALQNIDDVLQVSEGFLFFAVDLQGKILDWTPGVFRMLGFSKKEFVGCSFSIIFSPADAKAGVPAQELNQATEQGHRLQGRYHIRSDGREIWVEGTLVAHLNEEGKARGFSIVLRDETLRKELELELELLRQQVLDRSEFEGFVVHSQLDKP